MSAAISEPEPTDDVALDVREVVLALGDRPVLKGVDLQLRRGKVAVVFGRSGSGKTTLLRCIAGYLTSAGGSVRVFPKRPSAVLRSSGTIENSPEEGILGAWTMEGRSEGGLLYGKPSASAMMFADDSNLLPQLTAAENLLLALAPSCSDSTTRKTLVAAALSVVGLSDAARQTPGQLSSGQKRRLSLAQCIIRAPGLVALDEPTAALDTRTKYEMLAMMQNLQAKVGLTGLVVTHDIDTVLMLADEILYFDDGRVLRVEKIGIPRPRKPEDLNLSVYTLVHQRLVSFLMSSDLK